MGFRTTLNEAVSSYKMRFPNSGYGWRNAALNGTLTKTSYGYQLKAESHATCFDCGSASRVIRSLLSAERIRSELLMLQVPTNAEGKYTHYAVMVRRRDAHIVIGLTPFDSVLGINPLKAMDEREFQAFRATFDAKIFKERHKSDSPSLHIPPETRRFFPFALRQIDGSFFLTEFGLFFKDGVEELTLRASNLVFSESEKRLKFLSVLSFTLCFPHQRRAQMLKSSILEERLSEGNRWQVSRTLKGMEESSDTADFLPIIEEDWRAFSALFEKINSERNP